MRQVPGRPIRTAAIAIAVAVCVGAGWHASGVRAAKDRSVSGPSTSATASSAIASAATVSTPTAANEITSRAVVASPSSARGDTFAGLDAWASPSLGRQAFFSHSFRGLLYLCSPVVGTWALRGGSSVLLTLASDGVATFGLWVDGRLAWSRTGTFAVDRDTVTIRCLLEGASPGPSYEGLALDETCDYTHGLLVMPADGDVFARQG